MQKIEEILSSHTYPGRGIMIGATKNKEKIAIAYFIMGRSSNSRNRIFDVTDDGIRTMAFDESKLEDPSLIIYNPVRVYEDNVVVTNGDQTDTIVDFLKAGKTFEDALNTRCFEPDEPNYTPRISGLVKLGKEDFTYKLSILKSATSKSCERFIYNYNEPLESVLHFIHTYQKDENPLPSFVGEPIKLEAIDDIDEFTKTIWESLNKENKVSLFTRFINVKTKEIETRIVNKNS